VLVTAEPAERSNSASRANLKASNEQRGDEANFPPVCVVKKEREMKRILFAAVAMMLFVSEADAVIYCAAGVYRAGCVVRPGYGYHPYHPYARAYAHPYAHPYHRYYRRY
jgi:hypothetical protein